MSGAERASLDPALLDVVEYRKSGLSLNWIVGCPLDCGYCVRHLFGNFGMKVPRALMSDEQAFELLVGHRFFQPGVTPVQLLNRATDPMLARVKPHTFAMLRLLDEAGLRNHVLLITRWRVDEQDCAELNALRNLRVTLLVTHSGIEDPRIEPVDSAIAATSLRTAFAHARRYRVVLYWRPIVPGLNDSDTHLAQATALRRHAHATVFTGLFYRDEIRAYYRDHGLPEPYVDTARRKILPEQLEQRILTHAPPPDPALPLSPLFRKTSCAVAFAHGLPDYNGHVGIRELCDICPAAQLARCTSAHTRPSAEAVGAMAAGLGGRLVEVGAGAVTVAGLDEQHRYLMQHTLGYQVHDQARPHRLRRHGRAEIGWPSRPREAGSQVRAGGRPA
ncbi:radical SAM protein [Pseudonocardia lacus]|uniref:radical SAM protein n=1 Tax=Pseudonocardia lacus TaxID=2835865 RepID=UPI001BDBECF0|nr:radical SAM protein [Pseudonocardia lacus]